MSNRLIARRYTKALAEVAESFNGLLSIQEELAFIVNILHINDDFKRLIFCPQFTSTQKKEALDSILLEAGVSTTLRNFFGVVATAARLGLMYDLSKTFDDIVDERLNIVKAYVQTAQSMSNAQVKLLTKSLSILTGKKVIINWNQDCSIIGGLRVKVGSIIYDASIKGQLSLIKKKLVLM